jgi:hypothetical protein
MPDDVQTLGQLLRPAFAKALDKAKEAFGEVLDAEHPGLATAERKTRIIEATAAALVALHGPDDDGEPVNIMHEDVKEDE